MFYNQLCHDCGEINYLKRNIIQNLKGKVAIVTGGRIKIGFYTALQLLRCGAKVIITTRFADNALVRYKKLKDYNKALFYTNKAISIDPHNIAHWKRYAQINYKLDFYEEAERGYLQIIELGNYELKTWLKRSDILLQIGEIDTSIQVLLQGLEFYPENAEIEFRLSGLYYLKNEPQKGQYHLVNALQEEKEFVIILEELFSRVYQRKSVQEIIHKYL